MNTSEFISGIINQQLSELKDVLSVEELSMIETSISATSDLAFVKRCPVYLANDMFSRFWDEGIQPSDYIENYIRKTKEYEFVMCTISKFKTVIETNPECVLKDNELHDLVNILSTKENQTYQNYQQLSKLIDPYFSDIEMLGDFVSSCEDNEWKFSLSPEFIKSISKIDKKLQGRILEAITKITKSPTTPAGDTVKPLTNDLAGFWRYRIGDYRLIYVPNEKIREVTLMSFAARGSVYT